MINIKIKLICSPTINTQFVYSSVYILTFIWLIFQDLRIKQGKKIKIVHVTSVVQSLFNNFFSSMSVFDTCSQVYHNTYVLYSPERMAKTDTEEKKLLNKVIILVFLRLNHWCHMDYFSQVRKGQKALGYNPKYLNLCCEDERRSYAFGTKLEWAIKDRIFIFGGTISLKECSCLNI